MIATEQRGVVTTPGICSGYARVDETRIPVWLLVLHRQCGSTESDLLRYYPSLATADLDAVWEYYRINPLEIDRAIWWQDTAGNIPEGGPVPIAAIVDGILLGVDEDRLRTAFDPPLTREQIAAAWSEYRRAPHRSPGVSKPQLQAG